MAFSLQIFIFQYINGILFFYSAHGIKYGCEYHKEHAANCNCNAVPGNVEAGIEPVGNGTVNVPGYKE